MQIQKPADLARIVKTRRQALGLTQQGIADAVGITRQSLARIESGHGGASFETVLRVFGQLDIHLEAVRISQDQLAGSTRDEEGLRRVASDALASSQNVDTSALAAAAAAATRGIDTSALLSNWRNALNHLTVQVQDTGALRWSEIDAKEARKARLSAAIEAGDPDREKSTLEEQLDLRENSDGAGDG